MTTISPLTADVIAYSSGDLVRYSAENPDGASFLTDDEEAKMWAFRDHSAAVERVRRAMEDGIALLVSAKGASECEIDRATLGALAEISENTGIGWTGAVAISTPGATTYTRFDSLFDLASA